MRIILNYIFKFNPVHALSVRPSALRLALGFGFLAVILGTLNVVGGFVVTDRMLEMFKKKKMTLRKCSIDYKIF